MSLFGKKKEQKVEAQKVENGAEASVEVTASKVKTDGHLIVKIFCSAGMSTSLFAQNVQKEMTAQGRDMEIAAYSISEIDDEGQKADVILIGPQTRYAVPETKSKFPNKPVDAVPMTVFGRMNGADGLKFIDSLL